MTNSGGMSKIRMPQFKTWPRAHCCAAAVR
jgi:hypothetical protein